MKIQTIVVGKLKTNCYLVSVKSGETFIVDPGDEAEKILPELKKIAYCDLKYILLTHGHFDHVLAVDALKKEYPGAKVIAHENDLLQIRRLTEQGVFIGTFLRPLKSEIIAISDQAILPFGGEKIKVIATPGHSPGSVCYLYQNNLFSGDTLFWHTYGRTDLPESSAEKMAKSLPKLLKMPQNIKVFPGHGRVTSIGEEKRFWEKFY